MSEGVIRATGYPIFGLDWIVHEKSHKSILAIAGGGGSSKSGIQNRVTVCVLAPKTDKKAMTATLDEVMILDSKDDLITNISVHPTGEYMVCGIGAKSFVYSIDTKCTKFTLEHSFITDFKKEQPFQNVVRFNHKGTHFATGGEDGIVRLWQLDTCSKTIKVKEVFSLKGHSDYINALDFDAADALLVSSGKDGKCHLWNVQTGKKICALADPNTIVPTAAKGEKRAGKYIYRSCKFVTSSGGDSYLITILTPPRGASFVVQWSTPDPTDPKSNCSTLLKQVCLGYASSACTLATKKGYAVVGDSNGVVTLYNADTLDKIRVVAAHHLPVTGLCFDPVMDEPVTVMSASADHSMYLMRGHGSNMVRNVLILCLILVLLAFFFYFNQ